MLAENKRLKEEAAAVGKALEAAAVEALTLKNQHRAAQLELVQQREALQRIEVLRLAVEKENAALTKQLELEKASGELSSVELRNLRERNVKLEGDMKSWSERCAKLEEQLKNRDSAVSKSIEASDAANRELAAEIKALKEQLATQNRELKVLLDQKSSQEKALAAATMELAGKKSALLLAEEKLKKAGEGLARLGKLEPEFKTLQVNFQAMQKELAAGRKAAEELNASKTALAAAQTRLKELESVAAKFLAEQKRNQSLAEEVSRLKGELEARRLPRRFRPNRFRLFRASPRPPTGRRRNCLPPAAGRRPRNVGSLRSGIMRLRLPPSRQRRGGAAARQSLSAARGVRPGRTAAGEGVGPPIRTIRQLPRPAPKR